MPYAAKTSVSVEKTRMEIEQLVAKRGADQYLSAYQTAPARAVIQFRMKDRIVRFELPLPQAGDTEVLRYQQRFRAEALSQMTRARWRALLLVVKAKLEAVESGVTTFEEEFLAHIVMPGDQTVGQYVIPHLADAYASGKLPRLLPQFTETAVVEEVS